MTTRSDLFGRLLKAGIGSIANCEGRTAPAIEDQLGQQIGVAGHTIQRYKAGHLPPDPRAVRLLADACVRRGHLNREWLEAFLAAARYPQAMALLEQLCPAAAPRTLPPRVYQNLPAPTYTSFVMRRRAYDDLLDGLRQRSAVILIASLGGMGKTSLAREVAERCLHTDTAATQHDLARAVAAPELPDLPLFDAVVWVSDKDRPGTTNLSSVLDTIARTLDYPGITQLAHDEKRFEAELLLRRQRVLVVVDNFETITDGALLDWLLRLPEPSKALITTREYRREFRSSWPIDLHGMTDAEARALIDNRLRMLKLGTIGNLDLLTPLIAATGGNPKAIEITLGLVKYEHRSLEQALADLGAARGTLFNDLFARAWALLDQPARDLLLALTLFTTPAAAEALSATAGVHGPAYERAIERLTDLALIDVVPTQLNQPPRFAQHPLALAFAEARLAEQPAYEQAARVRWIDWYRQLAAQVGFCWYDLPRLDRLDAEHETMYSAIEWAFEHQQYGATIELIEGVRYYYNVRGMWDDRLAINMIRAEAAGRIGDISNQALGLAYHAEIRSKQGALHEADQLVQRLAGLAQHPELSGDAAFDLQHALALHARAHGDLAHAEQIWRDLLGLSATLERQRYVVNLRWLATCCYLRGDLAQARELFQASLDEARAIGDTRSVLGNTLKLATLDLARGDLVAAERALAECRAGAEQFRDRRRLGELYRLSAQLRQLRGDHAGARADLASALDLFERLGMRRELDDARVALANCAE